MKMDGLRMEFADFEQKLKENLAELVGQVLQAEAHVTYIGFVTTDDFYGAFVTYNQVGEENIWEHFEWKKGLSPDFLYQPLVDVVEKNEKINFMEPSKEKWQFAETLIEVFREQLQQLPDAIFTRPGYDRNELIFFMTVSDGDYMDEMMIESVERFNSKKAISRCLGTGWKNFKTREQLPSCLFFCLF
ncbi:DUF4303 domain-containing protein [Listeria ilorinensis]|uniref:DUF4303 domain-containing protein n=1 Tax=Listeria ilorinensis TaxID=2867439 RepID=UPI001EF4EB95|nr:DUF4303 domain-containing protein [Listeria ilorinensis]